MQNDPDNPSFCKPKRPRRKFRLQNLKEGVGEILNPQSPVPEIPQLWRDLYALQTGSDGARHHAAEPDAQLADNRAKNEAAKAKRLARRAAINDPDKRAREAAAFAEKERKRDAEQAAKAAKDVATVEKRAAELAANPTARWRTPRRPNWQPPADYQSGGKRQNKRRAGSPDRSTPG